MQISSLASSVRTANLGAVSSFTMEGNEFAFRVLSDGLYQNKIGSMVRETCCNGTDSHAEAGKSDTPISIHLPDAEEPYYSIQDFGVGLDDRGVRDTFATYFKSTKRTNNNAVGAFGLGSKTPFAYTDAFTITAIKDGKSRMYSAYLNEDGVPAISNMGGEEEEVYAVLNDDGEVIGEMLDQWTPTDLGNGVTITVPVTSTSDFTRFRNEVTNQLAFFPVKPTILNWQHPIAWMDWESSASSYLTLDNIMVGKADYNSTFRGLWVVQGPVGYKADVTLLAQHLSPDNNEFLSIIGDCALLRFSLGEIEVTPSREGLSYSKKTIAAIETLLDDGRKRLRSQMQAQVDALGDTWQTACRLNSNDTLRRLAHLSGVRLVSEGYYNSGSFYMLDLERIGNFQQMADADEASGGKLVNGLLSLNHDATWDQSEPADEEEEEEQEVTPEKEVLSELLNVQFLQYTRQRRSPRSSIRKWMPNAVAKQVKASTDFTVLVRDTADKPVVRLREYFEHYNVNRDAVYVLQTRTGTPINEDDLEAIAARIGVSWTFKRMSEVPLPARAASIGRTGYKMPTGYNYNAGDNRGNTSDWEREYDNLKLLDGAYYFIVERSRTNATYEDQLTINMADAGLLDKPVMAIRQRDADKLAGNSDWVPVSVKTAEILDGVRKNTTLHNAFRVNAIYCTAINAVNADLAASLQRACDNGDIIAASPLHRAFRISSVIARAKTRYKRHGFNHITQAALNMVGVKSDNTLQDKVHQYAKAQSETIRNAYPLLPFLTATKESGWDSPETKIQHIVDYVNSITA
jgi:hypothetical protein